MAKVSLKAGAEFDTLTRDELRAELDRLSRDWMAEVTRGFKFRPFYASAAISGGVVTIQQSQDNTLGPDPGLVWSVNSLTIGGLAVNDAVDVYLNSDPVASFVRLSSTGNFVNQVYGLTDLVLNSSDVLSVKGSGLTATGSVTVFGRCTELSHLLSYKLV